MMAIRLNISTLKQEVLESIPLKTVSIVVNDLGQMYVEGVLKFLGEILETTPHLGLYSTWAAALVTRHGQTLKIRAPQIMSTLNALQRSLTTHHTNLSKVCSHNEYTLEYLLAQGSLKREKESADMEIKEGEPDIKMNDAASDDEAQGGIEELFEDLETEP